MTAIAELADGGVALAEAPTPHQDRPQDGAVRRYDADGRLLATWTVPRPVLGDASRPSGLAAGPDGELWVADAANDRLLRFTPGGAVDATLGAPGTGPGELAVPQGLALDCDGGLLVADGGNDRIVRFPGVVAAAGCRPGAGPSTPTAGHPPAAVGLKLRTRTRASRPATVLGTVAASCRRACSLKARASASTIVGRQLRELPLTARVVGRTITVRAPAAARHGDQVHVGIIVTSTAADGVVDTATLTWSEVV